MTPASPPRNPYNAPAVRHRWIFVAGILVWVLLGAFGTFVVIHKLRNHLSFDFTFWTGVAAVVYISALLIRIGRLRRAASMQAEPHY